MKSFRDLLLATALVSMSVLSGATAAQANEAPNPEPLPAATVEHRPDKGPLPQPSASQAFLDENHVTGEVVDVQVDEKGAKFFLYSDGDWVLEPPAGAEGDMSISTTYGGCAGTFVNIYRNSFGELYWGGQSACAGTGTFYKHDLKISLRKGCTGVFCTMETKRTKYAPDSDYNAVQTVNGWEPCSSSVVYKYDMIAWPMVKSVQYGPFVDWDTFEVGCNI
jgi:hypothetical protein